MPKMMKKSYLPEWARKLPPDQSHTVIGGRPGGNSDFGLVVRDDESRVR